MKKIIVFIGFVLLSGCGSKKPLVSVNPSLLSAQNDVNAVKNQVEDMSGDISGVKAELPGLKKLVEANVQAQADIKAELKANLKAIAGVNNKIEETRAGRDIVQTTTNEAGLMRYIVGTLSGLCILLITGLIGCLRMFVKQRLQKKFYKDHLLLKTQSEEELKQLRQEHDKFVKGGGA